MSFGIKPLGDKVVIKKRSRRKDSRRYFISQPSEGKAFHRGSFGSGKRQQGC